MLIAQLRVAVLTALVALLASTQPDAGGLVALTLAALCVAVACARVALGDAEPAGAGPVRRRRVMGVLYLRHAHPDAEGHPRPRAPGRA